jgi:hypothetical protein
MKLYTRRVIRMASWDTATGGEIRTVVEDDYHHFRVGISHDGTRVTRTFTDAVRRPYDICLGAGDRLQELVGLELSPDPSFAQRQVDARLQCTHQFDIAALALAAAARGIKARRYDAAVPDPENGRTTAILKRDGVPILQWEMQRSTITGPDPYTGHDIGKGFTAWVASTLAPDEAEAALVLRRVVFISGGRNLSQAFVDSLPHRSACWVHQPERYYTRQRLDERQDFTTRPEALTADDDAWLAPTPATATQA